MIRIVALLKRRTDLSFDDFVRHYEQRHAPMAWSAMAGVERYVRRYIHPMAGAAAPRHPEPLVDVITELWVKDAETLDTVLARLSAADLARSLREDEAALFDLGTLTTYLVDECDSAASTP